MPELMINTAPTTPPSSPGNAIAPGQTDAASRSGEGTERGTESLFASLLKSRVGKKALIADAPGNVGTPPAAAQADAVNATVNVDLSALMPALGTNPAGIANPAVAGRSSTEPADQLTADPAAMATVLTMATLATAAAVQLSSPAPAYQVKADPAATTRLAAAPVAAMDHAAPAPDQELLPGLPAAAQAPPQVPWALPLAPTVPAVVMDTGSRKQDVEAGNAPLISAGVAPSDILPALPSALPSAPTAALAQGTRKQPAEQGDQAFTSSVAERPDGAKLAPGKLALDPAITADLGQRTGASHTPEPPGNDFPALMDRATAMAPGAPGATNNSSTSPSLRIDTPLGQTGWHEEMGQKLTWMAGNNHQQAEFVLAPPHLGRVEVSLTLNGDQATAIFTSSNPAVREALENSLYRLREVLADAGVTLGQAQVGSESPNQSARRQDTGLGINDGVRYAATIPLPNVGAVAGTAAGRGMIDIFA